MVFQFGAGEAEGTGESRDVLGGKGAGLAEMTALGVPVPPGFTISTDVCAHYARNRGDDGNAALPVGLVERVNAALLHMGGLVGTKFGDVEEPLLVSVRSGAPASMPGMMDTVLNLGLNDQTVVGLANRSGDPRFAYDCYRRFVAMYGEVVLGIGPANEHERNPFAEILDGVKHKRGVLDDAALSVQDLQNVVAESFELIERRGARFPHDPNEQLWGAISAVFASWNNPRAQIYRQMRGIADVPGTAVNVQAMVFGNMGATSATGVAFTRNPATGEPGLFGEFLVNAQGEEVVAGIRTPLPIETLQDSLPNAYGDLVALSDRLEAHFGDMQDIEFTVENGILWVLQTRTGKRSGRAMVRIAVDLVNEGRIDSREAVSRIEPTKLEELLHPTIDPSTRMPVLAKGLPASPGAAIGRVVFSAKSAEACASKGQSPILVRTETSPEDIAGMKVAAGILTARGGMTSHAAVVARGLGITCVTGCSSIRVDAIAQTLRIGDVVISAGDIVTLDGSTGEVFLGTAALVPAESSEALATLMGWADQFRRLRVRTNADTAEDAKTARSFGAEGIGLCRTEHMFFAPERILRVRQMILATDSQTRKQALAHILPMQRDDFVGLFRAMDGLPVTIRLLDPPLHEFLPKDQASIATTAKALGQPVDMIDAAIHELVEVNPMLGHRGCRLAIKFSEIYETQARAIAEALVLCLDEGIDVKPEIMIPFVSTPEELRLLHEQVSATVDEVLAENGQEVSYQVGTMIELPRACLVGDQIAEHADFFSFGTNDLTQTTFGFSRDDAARWLPEYLKREVLSFDPFVSLDVSGVGALVRIGVEKGRARKTKLKIGICGEHGGDPKSIEFCHLEGFDYVSCSPFRVPIARVAAAQAALVGEACL